MRAIRLYAHGGPEQLIYEEDAHEPRREPDDALIRVFACAIEPAELHWSATYSTRGGAKRLPSIPGHGVAGVVDQVPADGCRVKPGDAVYAFGDLWRDGGAAEYMAIRACDLVPKPTRLNFIEAASIPLPALTAWHALRDRAHVLKGQRVLIDDASGSVGMYAVQIAHCLGAYVIGIAAGDSQHLLRNLGADDVIDGKGKFEEKMGKLDVVFDTLGGDALERSWRVLRRGGALVTTEGSALLDKAEQYGVNAFEIIPEPSREALSEISALIDAGRIRPVIEAVFPLRSAKMAYDLALAKHHRGKIVLEVVQQRVATAVALNQ